MVWNCVLINCKVQRRSSMIKRLFFILEFCMILHKVWQKLTILYQISLQFYKYLLKFYKICVNFTIFMQPLSSVCKKDCKRHNFANYRCWKLQKVTVSLYFHTNMAVLDNHLTSITSINYISYYYNSSYTIQFNIFPGGFIHVIQGTKITKWLILFWLFEKHGLNVEL